MKLITKASRFAIKTLNLDCTMADASRFIPIAKKFIPQPYEYSKGTIRRVMREGVCFELDVSDYMQWHEFSRIPESSTDYIVSLLSSDSREKLIIDVGANIGSFSLKVAKKLESAYQAFKILSIEPNPSIFSLLARNLLLNQNLAKNIDCLKLAMGDKNSSVTFLINNENSGNSSVQSTSNPQPHCSSDTIIVPQITLDNLSSSLEEGQKIDAIKIDVEGYEPFVIDGGKETIIRFTPILYLEVTPSWFLQRGRNWADMWSFLVSQHYVLYHDSGKRLHKMVSPDSINSYQFNILALPSRYSGNKLRRYIA